jgi:hypothetical protein
VPARGADSSQEAGMLRVDRSDMAAAAAAGLISEAQAERLWSFLLRRSAPAPAALPGPRFTFTNVLYYLGGGLAIGAMSLFMTLGWERFGGWGIFFIALLYIGVALKFASWFEARGLEVPTGIMATLVVVLVPLAVWGLQHAFGLWPENGQIRGYREYHYLIDWRWLGLEFATLAAGVLMLYRWHAPFLLMPVAVTLWYMSMDLVMLLIDPDARWAPEAWTLRKWFSLTFGLLMLLVALSVDLRSRFSRDYAFWLYLFGLLTFWGALTALGSGALSGKLVYLAINAALIGIGAVLVRRAFAVFGALGIAIVLGDLSWNYFRDSWLFPVALTVIGLAIVFAGVWFGRNEAQLSARLRAMLPRDLRELIASRRSSLAD